jgi:hypothetical protein
MNQPTVSADGTISLPTKANTSEIVYAIIMRATPAMMMAAAFGSGKSERLELAMSDLTTEQLMAAARAAGVSDGELAIARKPLWERTDADSAELTRMRRERHGY